MGLSEVALATVVRAQARRLELADDPRVQELARYSPEERATLSLMAPLAGPYLERAAASSPGVGAAVFGLVFAFTLADHARRVRSLAAPGDPASSARPRARETESAPAEDRRPGRPAREGASSSADELDRHRQTWGSIADSVPVGVEAVDTGTWGRRAS